ncbi:MAG TPA: cell division protein ZapE [Caulobacteraceae bacterium]|nr:cell division protein ZapE [Caulobacteraceae bacterium]
MVLSLRAAYRERIDRGEIQPDPAQQGAIDALARLESDLNEAGEGSGFPFFRKPKAARGVYLWGPVGRGKSMLMDLFYETAPSHTKRRSHFHAFMAEVHGLIGEWRQGDTAARKRRFGQHKGDDPIGPVAAHLAAEARLFCFDELQVTDIADAMILGRLFEAMFAEGVTLVCTSNRAPDDLYKNGLNRQLFLPFIALIQDKLQVVPVKGPTDYRLDRLRGANLYLTPVDPDNRRQFDRLWTDLLQGAAETEATVEVLGRTLRFPRTAGGMVRAGFGDLCGAMLGPQDYLAIAERFHTVFLEDLPRLTADKRNEARRLVILIDELYEASAKLVALAEAQPEALYVQGDGAFEFERTVSRLEEMRSQSYLEKTRD